MHNDLPVKFSLTREVLIRSIHNLANPALTEAENQKLYGACYGSHGHHYKIRVTVTGPISDRSGFVMDRDLLDQILMDQVVKPLDGADLNRIFENTACEALARELYLRLQNSFAPAKLVSIGVQETRKNYFEYAPT